MIRIYDGLNKWKLIIWDHAKITTEVQMKESWAIFKNAFEQRRAQKNKGNLSEGNILLIWYTG